MKYKYTKLIQVILALTFLSFENPTNWFAAGSKPDSYDMGIEKGAGKDGKNAATIKSKDKKIKGFGTMMQDCSPEKYLGQRIRMSGFIKTENVESWTGFWLRVDDKKSSSPLSFDNMSNRRITGTTPWTIYEIILDVPANASNLAYGVLLNGVGQVWFDNLKFEIVDSTISTTGKINAGKSEVQLEPINLDFEK